jgi:uroporphyrinogen-III synthase
MNSERNNFCPERPLTGFGIAVTRAQHQAEWLSRKIEEAGGHAIRLPMLEIREPQNSSRLDVLLDRLQEFDIAIFVSANAVQYGVARIRARGAAFTHLKLAAIGRKTGTALRACGHSVDICPPQEYTSEALLELDAMRLVQGHRIVIFRGEEGRELLAQTLQARGAVVEYAEVYRRVMSPINSTALRRNLDRGLVDLITMTSAEGLRNLVDLGGTELKSRLCQIPLLVGSQRLLQVAHNLGFTNVLAARDPSDEAMFGAILQWAAERRAIRH